MGLACSSWIDTFLLFVLFTYFRSYTLPRVKGLFGRALFYGYEFGLLSHQTLIIVFYEWDTHGMMMVLLEDFLCYV